MLTYTALVYLVDWETYGISLDLYSDFVLLD